MTTFTCALIGNESLLAGCGDALLARGHGIAAVITTDSGLRSWAAKHGLEVLDSPRALQPGFDWLLSIANLRVIPDDVLARAAKGAVNFHDGPLPSYAGLNAPNWALINGEARYGITWHMLEGGIDEGDILAQRLFDVAEDETAFSLNSKCYAAAMDSFGEVITQLETGTLDRQPQDLSQRSYFAKADRPAAGGRLDFTRPAAELARLVRALDFGDYWNPLCAAKFEAGGNILLARRASAAEGTGVPGTVLEVTSSSLTVATGAGALQLTGISGASGQPVSLSTLISEGQVLPSLAATEALTLTAQMAAIQGGESHWRKALAAMQALPVPLGSETGEEGLASRIISLPGGITEAQAAAGVLGWALLSSAEDFGDIALTTTALSSAAIPGMISGWVPLQARRDEPAGALIARLQGRIETAQKLGGFAADLPARDPAIANADQPVIGLMLDANTPVEGCALTVALCDGKAVLYWDKAQISAQAADLLAERLSLALSGLAALGDKPLSAQPILPEAERKTILSDWNATAREYHADLTVHAAFESQAARSPDAAALVFEDQIFTYAQLNARANALAARLQEMGVAPGSHVGLHVKRGPALVAGALAILKAGGAYVPLDPAYPADRIAHYISDSQAQVILCDAALMQNLPASGAQVLDITASADGADLPNTDGGATASDLAYLIYTSGSTGTPKGVMVSHRNVANFFAGMDDRIPHKAGDSWLAVTSLSFDISVLELFWTLSRGFKLVLSSDESRLELSNGPIRASDRKMDFNLFYWGNDDGPGPRKYRLLLEGAKFADANGFNAVWTPERHFHAFGGPYPNPSVTGAAVAAVTSNLSVRAGSVVAPLHHPARVAEEWSVIDNLTSGRAGLGIAAGWQPNDFVLRPENAPPKNKPAMYETIDILRKLWRGEEVEFPHADGSTHAVVTQPRPVSKELPIWVTTAGNPDTWREAGEIGANVLTHLLGQSIEEVGGKIKIYHDALRANGHDPADFTVTLMLHTYLDQTREEARRISREPMKDYLRSAAGLIKQFAWAFPAFKRPKGVNNSFELDLGVLSEEELEAILDFAFERYFEESGLFGTVQDGLKRVEELKRIGVDEIACLVDYGIDPDVVLEGLKPLAEVLRLSNAPAELAEDDFSLAAQIIRHGVTHMQCTPSMARMIAMNDEAKLALGRLEHLMVGGEALPGDLAASLKGAMHGQIHNMYGPTETTIWSTVDTLDGMPEATANIGKPIANTSVYVLNDAGEPQPIGASGELMIGGEGVTSGYWQRPELTAERFIPDPFAGGSAKLYRTGDLVRWRSDGKLDFLGRSDHQVKIRGQRIELGEIEAAMAAYPGVTGAVAVTRTIGADERLVGYVAAPAPVDEAALKAQLARQLAEVMVPAHIVTLEAFPLTPNKKIDRKALPDPQPARAASAAAAAPPAQGSQALIAGVWSRVLGVEGIRAADNFFALGGHSLLAVQAHREIRKDAEAERLSITDIFRFPTLEGLAAHLDGLTGGAAPADAPEPAVDTEARTETMSKRRAMRANRKARAG